MGVGGDLEKSLEATVGVEINSENNAPGKTETPTSFKKIVMGGGNGCRGGQKIKGTGPGDPGNLG